MVPSAEDQELASRADDCPVSDTYSHNHTYLHRTGPDFSENRDTYPPRFHTSGYHLRQCGSHPHVPGQPGLCQRPVLRCPDCDYVLRRFRHQMGSREAGSARIGTAGLRGSDCNCRTYGTVLSFCTGLGLGTEFPAGSCGQFNRCRLSILHPASEETWSEEQYRPYAGNGERIQRPLRLYAHGNYDFRAECQRIGLVTGLDGFRTDCFRSGTGLSDSEGRILGPAAYAFLDGRL